MTIKKSVQCGKCKRFVDFYIDERETIKGVTVTCKCGSKQKCIDYNKYISRWKEIGNN